jgi:hypothetical protein
MTEVVSPRVAAAGLTELWSPRVIGELDDAYVKVAKLQGTFTWHSHDAEDELFFVLKGRLRIEMSSSASTSVKARCSSFRRAYAIVRSPSTSVWSCSWSANRRCIPATS